jgi:hypothetical protein
VAKRKSTDKVQLKVRLPESMRAEIEKAAQRNDVSLNQEIVERLARHSERRALSRDVFELAYGKQLAALLFAVCDLSRSVAVVCSTANDAYKGKLSPQGMDRCLEDKWTVGQIRDAADALFAALIGDDKVLPPLEKAMWLLDRGVAFPGSSFSKEVLKELRAGESASAPWVAEALQPLLKKGNSK